MMYKVGKFNYYSDGNVQVLGILYKGNKVKMFVLLPVERYGLPTFLEDTDGKKLLSYITRAAWREVEVRKNRIIFLEWWEKIDVDVFW